MQQQGQQQMLEFPPGIDLESPHSLLSLFISEQTFEEMSKNTNEFVKEKRAEIDSDFAHIRPWTDLNSAEIKVFFGIVIYMGVFQGPDIDSYLDGGLSDHCLGPVFGTRRFMTKPRFEQIKRFLRIRRPHPVDEEKRWDWWYKMEPWPSRAQMAARKFHTSGCEGYTSEDSLRSIWRTDRSSQYTVFDEVYRRCGCNWHRILHFVDAAVIHAHTLYRHHKRQEEKQYGQNEPRKGKGRLSLADLKQKLCEHFWTFADQVRPSPPPALGRAGALTSADSESS